MVTGIYGELSLCATSEGRIEHVMTAQAFKSGDCTVTVTVEVETVSAGNLLKKIARDVTLSRNSSKRIAQYKVNQLTDREDGSFLIVELKTSCAPSANATTANGAIRSTNTSAAIGMPAPWRPMVCCRP